MLRALHALPLALAMLGAGLPLAAAKRFGCTSSQSCATLHAAYGGWTVGGGSQLVCAETHTTGTDCPKETFAKAQGICLAVGARLCTLGELEDGETTSNGACGKGATWSSDKGTCKGSQHMSSGAKAGAKAGCQANAQKLNVRCCADIQVGVPCKGSKSACTIDHDNNGQVDMLETVEAACCPNYMCQMNMITGVPLTCSRDCAAEFLPFYRACRGKIQFGADDNAFSGFDDLCRGSWVSSGAQMTTSITGCNMDSLQEACPSSELMMGMKYHSVKDLCSSSCAKAVSGEYDSCESNPATYQQVQKFGHLHQQCSIYQCINTADTMHALVNQLCCSKGNTCATPDKCDPDCAATLIPWYDQCAATLSLDKSISSLYKKCTTLQHIPLDCPEQKSDAFFGVRTATQAVDTNSQSYTQTVAFLNKEIADASARQAGMVTKLDQVIAAENLVKTNVSYMQSNFTASENAYNVAYTDCLQPGTMGAGDCVDGSRVRKAKQARTARNATWHDALRTAAYMDTQVEAARTNVTQANGDMAVQQQTMTYEVTSAQDAQSKLRSAKAAAYHTLTKVLKLCTAKNTTVVPEGPSHH